MAASDQTNPIDFLQNPHWRAIKFLSNGILNLILTYFNIKTKTKQKQVASMKLTEFLIMVR